MLVEFSVENFLSMKDKVTLSMLASTDDSNMSNVINTEHVKGNKLLKSAVIYGANASGKTNIVKAFSFINYLINNSHKFQKGELISVKPFIFDDNFINQPSKFDIIFIHNNMKYNYGFSLDQNQIYEEYLYCYKTKKPTMIFNRYDSNKIEFSSDKKEQEALFSRTAKNKLYLSVATQWNYQKVTDAFEWFNKGFAPVLEINLYNWISYTGSQIMEDPDFKSKIERYLTQADFGIDHINIDKIENVEIVEPDIPEERKQDLILHLQEREYVDINLYHKIKNKNNEITLIPLNFNNESAGTQKFFAMLGPWIDVLENGKTLVIDEFSNKLHPMLTYFLIKIFNSEKFNTKNAQLIITTHDTNLLDLDLFRRDQIWFTEKNPETASTDLYSLDDINGVRKDENIEKGYLLGRYGAIPYLGDYSLLCQE